MEIIARNDVPSQAQEEHLLAMAATQYRLAMGKCGVPAHLHDGLVAYLVHHRMTGSFLRAVLDNNLRLAFLRADAASAAGLPGLVAFLVDWAPMVAWGSEDLVDAWLRRENLG